MGPTGATGNMALASGAGALNRTGGTGGGVAGAAPSAPASTGSGGGGGRVSMAAFIMGGGGKNQSANCRETGVCNPGAPPKPPPKKPTAQIGSGGMVATAADHAVEQVMRKLGKSMSRRPLGREGTKFEALKKKLRKQKSKKR